MESADATWDASAPGGNKSSLFGGWQLSTGESTTVVGVIAISISGPCTIILFLVLAGVVNHSLVEHLPFKHGAGFMILVLLGMLAGQAYLLVSAAAALFTSGPATCAVLTVLLTYHYALVLFPVLGQMWMLWLSLRVREPKLADDSQRMIWTPSSSRIAFTLVVLLSVVSAIYLTLSLSAPTSRCRSQFAGFDLPFFPSNSADGDGSTVLITVQVAMWLVGWGPLPVVALLVARLSTSRFIPIFGARWTKLSRLWVALALSIVFSVFSSLHTSTTTVLLTRLTSVVALSAYALLLYFGRAAHVFYATHIAVSAAGRPYALDPGASTRGFEEACEREVRYPPSPFRDAPRPAHFPPCLPVVSTPCTPPAPFGPPGAAGHLPVLDVGESQGGARAPLRASCSARAHQSRGRVAPSSRKARSRTPPPLRRPRERLRVRTRRRA